MAIDLANDWLRKDNATASSTVYYGYAVDPASATASSVWAIRKVTTSGSVDTVTWNENIFLSYNAVWNDRVETFIAPTASLNLTYSVTSNTNSFAVVSSRINSSWTDIKGVNQYRISITDQNGVLYDYLGNPFSNTYATTRLTSVQSNNSYQFIGVPSMTYSLSVTALNIAGSTSSTATIKT
jgi:hypothetical protein